MLDINHEIVQQIANMPTDHSWAVSFMKLPVEQADKAEAIILDWIEDTIMSMYPQSDQAERLVRSIWLHMLEAPAIEMWIDENPEKGRYIPVILGPSQGVLYATMDVMYVSQEDITAAEEFLSLMREGKIMPDIQKIMRTVLCTTQKECEFSHYDRLHGSTAIIAILKDGATGLFSATAKLGYGTILKNKYEFSEWKEMMHNLLDDMIHKHLYLTDEQIDEFICDIWNYPFTYQEETHLIKEWAYILNKTQ